MKYVKLGVAGLVLVASCTLFGGSTVVSPNTSTQEIARSVVLTLTDVWNLTGQMCVDTSTAEGVDGGGQALRDKCRGVLMPALEELHAAALLVDSWDAASQHNFGCAIDRAVAGIDEAWLGAGKPEPPLVRDAFAQARNFMQSSCCDGGVQ